MRSSLIVTDGEVSLLHQWMAQDARRFEKVRLADVLWVLPHGRGGIVKTKGQRILEHAIEHLRPLAQGDTMRGVRPNGEALAISSMADAMVRMVMERWVLPTEGVQS